MIALTQLTVHYVDIFKGIQNSITLDHRELKLDGVKGDFANPL